MSEDRDFWHDPKIPPRRSWQILARLRDAKDRHEYNGWFFGEGLKSEVENLRGQTHSRTNITKEGA
jgi:hypothetical protein